MSVEQRLVDGMQGSGITRRSTGAAVGAFSVFHGFWPPPGCLGRYAPKHWNEHKECGTALNATKVLKTHLSCAGIAVHRVKAKLTSRFNIMQNRKTIRKYQPQQYHPYTF
jgi:hypothetical protein